MHGRCTPPKQSGDGPAPSPWVSASFSGGSFERILFRNVCGQPKRFELNGLSSFLKVLSMSFFGPKKRL